MLLLLLFFQVSLSAAVQSGIFGGHQAKPHSRPYMASLQVRGDHRCGGVLVRDDYVLTAAHCLKFGPLEVVLGAHDISNRQESSQQRIQVKQFHRHPQFRNPEQFDYDIMLLKLESRAKLGPCVEVAKLPQEAEEEEEEGLKRQRRLVNVTDLPAGQRCWVCGWGMQKPDSPPEHLLREAQVQLEELKHCELRWKQHFKPQHMICSSTRDNTGFCQGDSGGPLLCEERRVWRVEGLDAFTHPDCTEPAYPQVYTRVSAFLPWIDKVMGSSHPSRWT